MSCLTKDEIATWIRNLVPYLENPMVLAPKGCFSKNVQPSPGRIIEYDATLMPNHPIPLTQTDNFKALVQLYCMADDK